MVALQAVALGLTAAAGSAAASCIHVDRHAEARDDALAFTAGIQRAVRMPIERDNSCTPDLHVSFMVVELAVIAGRAGRGYLVTYAVTDERDGDVRPHMGATWGMDRTRALLDAGLSAGAGIRSRSPGF
ncbi:hypothetical protein [Neoroseomonas lacus]|uniref:DUF4864 domain-containing protein n=1 Tax=Neoroseomonas lacus TaxID=287609 RepID=A0A917NNW6_9PROT|nr:hypothetical protein [Neoroseomonas lacus]GGJ14686.1 hypothetical protein GCM10011320_22430 [Neoroseomonas lacus]